MIYTVVVSDRSLYRAGEEHAFVCEGDLTYVHGAAQVRMASAILERRHGKNADPHDHEDEWMDIYDCIPVIAIIEGTPKLWLNDPVVEADADNFHREEIV
jgi:hypothetical protein